MALLECDRIHGKTTLYEPDPVCGVFDDILYMPVFPGEDARSVRTHGLYDGNGLLLEAAGRFRGPTRERAGPVPYTPQRLAGLPLQPGPFFYLGRYTPHYGHFLLDTLCRLWAWPAQGLSGVKILYHDFEPVERLFALPFAAAIFQACGLGLENFVKFDEPVRLGQVIVPSPAIEELGFVYKAFARKLNEIGDGLCPGPLGPMSDVPVYLTKQNVSAGISHFVNEARFTEVLARAGVKIIVPETLSFAEQVGLFRNNRVISGLIGSAFHTSLFTPACRMLVLNYERTVWSNQLLIDRANGNEAVFVYDPETKPAHGGQGFLNNFEMVDPVRLAEDFLRRLEVFAAVPKRGAPQHGAVSSSASGLTAVAAQSTRVESAAERADKVTGRIGCVGIVRNEEAHIAEWLAWQFYAGFDTVFLLDNASTDGTAAIARAMAPRLDVRVFDYAYRGADYQLRGYEQIARAVAAEFEWLAFFDTDEFLRLDEGLNLKTLLAQRPEAAVAVPWAMFGSNGHAEKPDGLVIESFTRRAGADFPPNRHVKSIVRPALMEAVTNPHVFAMRGGYVDLIGRPIAWDHVQGGLIAHDPDYAGGALNHYFTRSAAHWREKLARGYPDTSRAPEDFAAYDRNEVEDTRLAVRAHALRALMTPPRYRFAICACARWETPYIVEWLSYYRELGFEHIYLYCNDDDPGALYERVLPFTQGAAPFVTFRHHAHQGQQYEMYVHFAGHGLAETEWVAFFDIDEFLRLPPGMDIAGFMRRFRPEVECVMFNWVFFGPNGHKTPPGGNVLENFTRREVEIHPYTKFVARASVVGEIDFTLRGMAHGFWHEIGTKLPRAVIAANVLGEQMLDYYQDFPSRPAIFVNEPARRDKLLDTAVIHHYGFRSEQAYAERSARGLKGDFSGQGIWKKVAEGPGFAGLLAKVNAVEDLRLAGFWQSVRARAAVLGTGLEAWDVTPTRADNISRGKKAMQSSHCRHSFAATLEADAAGGVNGVLDGARHFHTDMEDDPWWQVDLGAIATITEIHVINTTDGMRGRFRDFALRVSIDGDSWVDVLEKRDGQAVEAPVVWAGPGTAWARYVRVTLLGRDFLHLNQVEVFGHF